MAASLNVLYPRIGNDKFGDWAMNSRILCSLVTLVLAPAGNILAGPCDAQYAFDGDLIDSSGSGHDGRMIAWGGAAATAQFPVRRHLNGGKTQSRAQKSLRRDHTPKARYSDCN